MRIALSMNHEELVSLQTAVVVEMWDNKSGGRVKRAWLKEFNEEERKKAGTLYKIFYDWYLRKGIPQQKFFFPGTITFIQKLVNFFGCI